MRIFAIAVAIVAVLMVIGAAVFWDANRDQTSDQKQALAVRQAHETDLDHEQRRLAAAIQKFQGRGKCEVDSDCRVSGLGAKTCDGYLNFLFYSVRDANVEALIPVLNEFNRNQDELNNLSLAVPRCGVKTPSVQCVDKVCASPEPGISQGSR